MRFIAAALATLTLASPALAGGPTVVMDEPIITAAPAPMMTSVDWSGAYVGAQIGYADGEADLVGGGTAGGYGLLGGVHAGYRMDFGQYVAGVEVDYDKADIDLEGDLGTVDEIARLKLMGGAKFGNSLVYATAGAAYADATVGGSGFSDNGYFLGAGMDYAISDSLSVGGELLQHKFDNFDDQEIDIDATTVKAKVSLRF